MIEQTEMMVTEWHFHIPADTADLSNITNNTTLAVMKKRAATKKGIACKLRCRFMYVKNRFWIILLNIPM